MNINNTPEMYDDVSIDDKEKEKEQLLMNETDILQGILDLAKNKDLPENYRKIQIKRNGQLKLEFRVRPLGEDENRLCWKQATPRVKNKGAEPETNVVKYRSLLIYSATINEDRAKIWDNQKAKDALGIFESWEMIDNIILPGEKSRIIEIIDEISGSDADVEENAKN